MSAISRKTYDTDVITLRRMFANDPETNNYISAGLILVTGEFGAASFQDILSISSISEISTMVNIGAVSGICSLSTVVTSGLSSLSTLFGSNGTFFYSTTNYFYETISTVYADGTNIFYDVGNVFLNLPYLSSYSLSTGNVTTSSISFKDTTTNATQLLAVSSGVLTLNGQGITATGDVTAANLISTVAGLGSAGYVSTASLSGLVSTANLSGLVSTPNLENLVSTAYLQEQLVSTVKGLGSAGYISSLSTFSLSTGNVLTSSVSFLDINTGQQQLLAVSSGTLVLNGQGISGGGGDVTTTSLVSTVAGLGSAGYVSTLSNWSEFPAVSPVTLLDNDPRIVNTGNITNTIVLQTEAVAIEDKNNAPGFITLGSVTFRTSTSSAVYTIVNDELATDTVSSLGLLYFDGTSIQMGSLYLSSMYLGGFGGSVYGQLTTNGTATDLFWNGSTLVGGGSGEVTTSQLVSTVINFQTDFKTQQISTGFVQLSSVNVLDTYTNSLNYLTVSSGSLLLNGGFITGSGGGAVSQIVAGSNIFLSPSGGTGAVTINTTIDPTGLVSTANLSGLVSTPNLSGLLSTGSILGVVSTANLSGLVSTPNLSGILSTGSILGLVSTANLSGLVSTPNLSGLLSTANLSGLVSTANLSGLVSTPNLSGLLSTANLSGLVSTANLSGLVSTPNLSGLVSTPNLLNLVSTSYLASQLASTVGGLGAAGYISTSQLVSTTAGLQSYISSFIDPVELASTVTNLISATFFTNSLTSTVGGLGTIYLSSLPLYLSALTVSTGSLNVSSLFFFDETNPTIGAGLIKNTGFGMQYIGVSHTFFNLAEDNTAPVVTNSLDLVVASPDVFAYQFTAGSKYTGTVSAPTIYLGAVASTGSLYISSLYLGNDGGRAFGELGTNESGTDVFWNGSTLLGGITTTNLVSTTEGLQTNFIGQQAVLSTLYVNQFPDMAPFWDSKVPVAGFDPEPNPLAVDIFGSLRVLKNIYIGSTTTKIGTGGILTALVNTSTVTAESLLSSPNIITSTITFKDTNTSESQILAVSSGTLTLNGLGITGTGGGITTDQLVSTVGNFQTDFDSQKISTGFVQLSSVNLLDTFTNALNYLTVSTGSLLLNGGYITGSGGTAVSQIVAGSNITVTPAGGTGIVTVNNAINPTGLVSTANLIGLVSTPNLLNLVSTTFLASQLASTVGGLGRAGYVSTANLSGLVSTPNLQNLVSTANLSGLVSTPNLLNLVSTPFLASQLASTVANLGQAGYISSSQLGSTVVGLQSFVSSAYIDPVELASTVTTLISATFFTNSLASTVGGLGRAGYVSTANLVGLVSTPNLQNLVSTANLVGLVSTPNLLNLVSTTFLASQLASTVGGLSQAGYISSSQLGSTVVGLQSFVSSSYIDPVELASTVTTLISATFFTNSLASTVGGLGRAGYVSTANLVGLVSTPNLQNLVSTANLSGLVSTQNLQNLVSTANLSGLVSTPNLLNLVSTTYLASQLASTVGGLGRAGYVSTANLLGLVSTPNLQNLVSTANLTGLVSTQNLQNLVSTANLVGLVSTPNLLNLVSTTFFASQLASTVANLGQAGYISSSQLGSTVVGLQSFVSSSYIDPVELASTVTTLISATFFTNSLASTVGGLGRAGYVSTANLIGLVSTPNLSGLVSTQNLQNLVSTANLSGLVSTPNLLNLVSTNYFTSQLVSTVANLGQAGYISSQQLGSTVVGLQTYISSFIDPTELASTVTNLISATFFTNSLASTVGGLGQAGYVSTANLVGLVSTPNLSELVSTSYLTSVVNGLGTQGYVSTSYLSNAIQFLTIPYAGYNVANNLFQLKAESDQLNFGTFGEKAQIYIADIHAAAYNFNIPDPVIVIEQPGFTQVVQSNFTLPGSYSFTVPAGITQLDITLAGAGGSTDQAVSFIGGAGGLVSGTLAVTPGETLTILVGEQGNSAGTAAIGGGGLGVSLASGGGGGRSAIRRGADIVTAGGGGGAGVGNNGGDGGGTTGAAGAGARGGGGGTQSAGGSVSGSSATPGTKDTGGDGETTTGREGGGGGGGYYGGGGGGENDGGGGGSSYVANLSGTVVDVQGGGSPSRNDGYVTINISQLFKSQADILQVRNFLSSYIKIDPYLRLGINVSSINSSFQLDVNGDARMSTLTLGSVPSTGILTTDSARNLFWNGVQINGGSGITNADLVSSMASWSIYPAISTIILSTTSGTILMDDPIGVLTIQASNTAFTDISQNPAEIFFGMAQIKHSSDIKPIYLNTTSYYTPNPRALGVYDGGTNETGSLYLSSIYLGDKTGTILGELTTNGTATDLFWNGSTLLGGGGGGDVTAAQLVSTVIDFQTDFKTEKISTGFVELSTVNLLDTYTNALNYLTVSTGSLLLNGGYITGSGGSAVSQILAGSNINVNPAGGTGVVTINNTIDPTGLVSTANLSGLVSTPNLSRLLSTGSILGVVSTANLLGLVSTQNLQGLVSTPNLLNLVSTANLFGLVSTQNLQNLVSTANLVGLVSTPNLLNLVSTTFLASQLASTLGGLSQAGYISSQQLGSTVVGLQSFVSSSYIDPVELASTVTTLISATFFTNSLASTVGGLGRAGYVSTASLLGLVSTPNLQNLVSTANLVGLVSTPNLLNLVSTANLVGLVSTPNLLNLVSTTFLASQLASTVANLGQAGYISSSQLGSTVVGLQSFVSSSYIDPVELASTVTTLISATFFTNSLASTVGGLGRAGYVSTASLTSTLASVGTFLSTMSSSYATLFFTNTATISALTVSSLTFGTGDGFLAMPDIRPTSMSTLVTQTSSLAAFNLLIGATSTVTAIQYFGLNGNFNNTVLAERSISTGAQEFLIFKGSSPADQIRFQTTGIFEIETGVSARLWSTVTQNAIPAFMIDINSNVGIRTASPGATLDVAGSFRSQTVSTQQIRFSTLFGGYAETTRASSIQLTASSIYATLAGPTTFVLLEA